jgi:hypothetical protein
MILDIVSSSHPLLTTKLAKWDFANPPMDANELANNLIGTMVDREGLGLSANQCGLPYRAFVMWSNPTKVCFILDYQLDGNVKWPIVVKLEEFTLENNECLVFDNNMAIHWRTPQKFKEGEYLTMLFYSFKDENKVPPTLDGQAEEINMYFKEYIDKYNEVFGDSGTQSKVSFQTSRLADLFRWAQERDKPKNNEL